jgi:hypothetical protein
LLNTTAFVPAEEPAIIAARFRIFPNNDLEKLGGGGNKVQPGSKQAPVYQNFQGFFLTVKTAPSGDNIGMVFGELSL